MTREEAIQEFQNVKDLIRQDGKDWFDERDFELIDMAIEALSEPIKCDENREIICGRPIKTSGYVFDDDFVESEVEE